MRTIKMKIVLLVEAPFNARDYARFGVRTLRDEGFSVEVWDLSPFLRPETRHAQMEHFVSPEVRLFGTEQETLEAVGRLRPPCAALVYLGCEDSHAGIYRALSRQAVPYGFILNNSNIDLVTQWTSLRGMGRILSKARKTLSRLLSRTKPVRAALAPPDFVVAGGRHLPRRQYPIGRDTRIVWTHTFDYDAFLELGGRQNGPSEDTVVFLDQFLPFHPDWAVEGRNAQVKAQDYFPTLNRLFNYIERRFGCEVVVAAHPRSDYETRPGCFGTRRVIKGQTASLVRSCRFVLTHFSAGVNFANLYEKPALFLDSKRHPHLPDLNLAKRMAAEFGKLKADMDAPERIDWDRQLSVNGAAYARYRELYIKTPGSPDKPIWAIFADYARELSRR